MPANFQRFIFLNIKAFNFYFSLNDSLKYMIIQTFLFLPLLSFLVSPTLCYFIPFRSIPCRIFTVVYNQPTQHSQHTPLLLYYKPNFSYIFCSKYWHFHYFPLYMTKTDVLMNLNECDRKYGWHILCQ